MHRVIKLDLNVELDANQIMWHCLMIVILKLQPLGNFKVLSKDILTEVRDMVVMKVFQRKVPENHLHRCNLFPSSYIKPEV